MRNEREYQVRAFYQGWYYVKEYRYYEMNNDNILDLTQDKRFAKKLTLGTASKVAQFLRSKGFVDISIEEVK